MTRSFYTDVVTRTRALVQTNSHGVSTRTWSPDTDTSDEITGCRIQPVDATEADAGNTQTVTHRLFAAINADIVADDRIQPVTPVDASPELYDVVGEPKRVRGAVASVSHLEALLRRVN